MVADGCNDARRVGVRTSHPQLVLQDDQKSPADTGMLNELTPSEAGRDATWPLFVIAFGVAASIAWTAALGLLVLHLAQLIL